MDKQLITEEMHLEKEWFEEAKNVKSIEELSKFVDKMLNSYEHDYGTIIHAIAACSVACSWFGARVKGITGFQASLVMWDYIMHWTKTHNKCGLRLVDYDDFLYPQYRYKYEKVISESTWAAIQEEARKRLDKDDGSACPGVRLHWESIVNGVVPFGYMVKDDEI